MSNDLGHREVCAVTALDHGDELDDFTTHRARRNKKEARERE